MFTNHPHRHRVSLTSCLTSFVTDSLLCSFQTQNWCSVCVRAKGKDLDHRSDPLKERSVPEYSFDFAFPGDEFGHKTAVLVGKERMSRRVLAAAIPVNSEGRYLLDKVLDYLAEAGDMEGRIIIKSDQEPAVKRLVMDLFEARAEGKSVVEESPAGSSSGRADQGDLAGAGGGD